MAARYDMVDGEDVYGDYYQAPVESEVTAGEQSAMDYMMAALDFVGFEENNPLVSTITGWADSYSTGGPAAAGRLSESNLTGTSTTDIEAPKQEDDNVFTRMAEKMGGGISRAYDKDPLKFLEMGLGAIAGVTKRNDARDAADRLSQSRMAEVNAQAAAKKEAEDRYNASFTVSAPRKVVAKPLTRLDGSRVYGAAGKPQR